MFTGISREFGARLQTLVHDQESRPGAGIVPFGQRPIPQPLEGDGDLVAIELLDDLAPCGSAMACSLDLSTDPPTANYLDTFVVEDFFGLSGLIGYRGWAKKVGVTEEGSGSDSGSIDIYKLVNLGPPCSSGSETSGSESSGSESSGSESSGSDSSGSESSSSESSGSSGCPGGYYWVPIRDCAEGSGSANIVGWQIVYLPPGTCPPDDTWQPAQFPGGGPTPPTQP